MDSANVANAWLLGGKWPFQNKYLLLSGSSPWLRGDRGFAPLGQGGFGPTYLQAKRGSAGYGARSPCTCCDERGGVRGVESCGR